MAQHRIFDLQGGPYQNRIIQQAVDGCKFPFEALLPGLYQQTGKSLIPVEWVDLSRYSNTVAAESSGHEHYIEPPKKSMFRKHGGSDEGHVVADARKRALGLAWYSGKISIEQDLENDPRLAAEVFLAEGAHMIDFFFMDDHDRTAIFAAYHDGDPTAHDHGWFEETGNQDYWSWVGESFMGGFIQAYTDEQVTLDSFVHKSPEAIGPVIRQILTPYFAGGTSKKFHDSHKGRRQDTLFTDRQTAIDFGYTPCGTCKP